MDEMVDGQGEDGEEGDVVAEVEAKSDMESQMLIGQLEGGDGKKEDPVREVETNVDVDAQMLNGAVRTLDGEIAGDEFAGDAINYQILLGKIDALLERLKLDA